MKSRKRSRTKRSRRRSPKRTTHQPRSSITKIISIEKTCYGTIVSKPCKHDIIVQYENKEIEKIRMKEPDIIKLATKLNYTNRRLFLLWK